MLADAVEGHFGGGRDFDDEQVLGGFADTKSAERFADLFS